MKCKIVQINNEQEWLAESKWLEKRSEPDLNIEKAVHEITGNVRENGDEAIINYTRRFDCPDFSYPFNVSSRDIARAAISVSADIRDHISLAAANIRSFHEMQLEKSWFVTKPDGSILGQRVLPVDSCGLYVPGGQGGDVPLISSLLMTAIPAQTAGCKRIAIATPPRLDGTISPYLLAAAHLLDIDEVYRIGGAWSIAAFAYGTKSIKKVDMIAGPGNIYVTTAKKIVHGTVGIDMIAGPSEILVLADHSANPAWVAADMLSQAEHDSLASAICITDDQRLADAINNELEKQLPLLPRSAIAAKSLADWGCIAVVPGMKTAINIANLIAPEHLELCCRDPWQIMPLIRHAGAVFMGQHTPEASGDYFAGPNHVLPTLGTARFSSALSVQSFCKKTNIVCSSKNFMSQNSQIIASLARLESLEGHALSAEAREKGW